MTVTTSSIFFISLLALGSVVEGGEFSVRYVDPPRGEDSDELAHKFLDEWDTNRERFNEVQAASRDGKGDVPPGWDRQGELLGLAENLLSVSVTAMVTKPGKDFQITHNRDGLKVWRKIHNGRLLLRAEFLVPVAPKPYAQLASDIHFRKEWDSHCKEIRVVEEPREDVGVFYLATTRVFAVSPRDSVNLRIEAALPVEVQEGGMEAEEEGGVGEVEAGHAEDRQAIWHVDEESVREEKKRRRRSRRKKRRRKNRGGRRRKGRRNNSVMSADEEDEDGWEGGELVDEEEGEDHDMFSYTSCSCSIEHPDFKKRTDRVPLDLRISSFIAEPVKTPFGLWSRVTTVTDMDPRGWIPKAVVRYATTQAAPAMLEKFLRILYRKRHIDWKSEGSSALGYCGHRLRKEQGGHGGHLKVADPRYISSEEAETRDDLPKDGDGDGVLHEDDWETESGEGGADHEEVESEEFSEEEKEEEGGAAEGLEADEDEPAESAVPSDLAPNVEEEGGEEQPSEDEKGEAESISSVVVVVEDKEQETDSGSDSASGEELEAVEEDTPETATA